MGPVRLSFSKLAITLVTSIFFPPQRKKKKLVTKLYEDKYLENEKLYWCQEASFKGRRKDALLGILATQLSYEQNSKL